MSAGVDQKLASPIDVAPSSRFWMPAATAVAVLEVEHRVVVRAGAHHEHRGRAEVLRARLEPLALVAEVGLDHVGDHRVAEAGAAVAREQGEPPRPGLLVVRRPGDELAQLLDDFRRHRARLVHEHRGATVLDQAGEVVEGDGGRHGLRMSGGRPDQHLGTGLAGGEVERPGVR